MPQFREVISRQAEQIKDLEVRVDGLNEQIANLETSMERQVDQKVSEKYRELEEQRESQWRMDNENKHTQIRGLSAENQQQAVDIAAHEKIKDDVLVGELKYAFEKHALHRFVFPPEFGKLAPKTFGAAKRIFKNDWSTLTDDDKRAGELALLQKKLRAEFQAYCKKNITLFHRLACSAIKDIRNPVAHPPIDLTKKGAFQQMQATIARVIPDNATAAHVTDIARKLYTLQQEVGVVTD